MPRYYSNGRRKRRSFRRGRNFGRSFMRHTSQRELKTFQDEIDGFTLSTSWQAVNPPITDCLVAPAQGVGADDRIGNVYHIESLMIKGAVCTPEIEQAASPQADVAVRIVIGIDKNAEGSEIVPANVLDLAWADDFHCFRELKKVENYTVLMDQVVVLPARGYSEGSINQFAHPGRCTPFTYYKKFPGGLKVKCSGTGNTVASIQTNGLFMMAIEESTGGSRLDCQIRARFRG